MRGERAKRGKFQQVRQFQLFFHAGLGLNLGDHLYAQQGMAAEGEEIVVGRHFLDAQCARPDRGHLFLKRVGHGPVHNGIEPKL